MGKYERKRRLPIHVILGYLLLATVLLTGVTVSKYVTSSSGEDEARVASFGDLELTESKPNKYIVTPGVPIEKNPVVNFGVKKKSETSAYVFVVVSAPNWNFSQTADKTNNTYTATATSVTKSVMTWKINENWKCMHNFGTYQVYYHYMEPGEKLENESVIQDGEITVSDNLYRTDYGPLILATKNITFEAYAVQQEGVTGDWYAWGKVQSMVPKYK